MLDDNKFSITLSKKQAYTLQVLDEPDVEEVLYGGAKGGGKTVFGCFWSYLRCKFIIKQFALEPRRHPIVVGFMGRKQSVDFNTTTLNTWKTVIPECEYIIKKQEKLIVINNTVALQFGGMDDSKTVKKFNSAEYGFYFLDQAEEISEDDIGLIRGTRRLKISGRGLDYKGLLTANPAICFLKGTFVDPLTRLKGNRFIQALPSDNPFLPASYVDQLKKAFGHKPELLRAYLYGSWDDLDMANVVIPFSVVKANVCNAQHDKSIIKRITVCDVGGDEDKADETVIYDLENTRIAEQEIYSHRSTMDTCGRIQSHARKNKSNLIAVDVIGIGKGVYDKLVEVYEDDSDMVVYGFDSRKRGEDIGDSVTFGNKRAEAWWRGGLLFAENRCDIPNDPVLIKQLSGVTYKFKSDGRIYIDRKEDIRKNLGCSPDRADTYIMALDALEIAKPYTKVDKYMREQEEDEILSPERC